MSLVTILINRPKIIEYCSDMHVSICKYCWKQRETLSQHDLSHLNDIFSRISLFYQSLFAYTSILEYMCQYNDINSSARNVC